MLYCPRNEGSRGLVENYSVVLGHRRSDFNEWMGPALAPGCRRKIPSRLGGISGPARFLVPRIRFGTHHAERISGSDAVLPPETVQPRRIRGVYVRAVEGVCRCARGAGSGDEVGKIPDQLDQQRATGTESVPN